MRLFILMFVCLSFIIGCAATGTVNDLQKPESKVETVNYTITASKEASKVINKAYNTLYTKPEDKQNLSDVEWVELVLSYHIQVTIQKYLEVKKSKIE